MAYQQTMAISNSKKKAHRFKTCPENRSQSELSQGKVLVRRCDRSPNPAIIRTPCEQDVVIGGKQNWVTIVAGKNCPLKVFSDISFAGPPRLTAVTRVTWTT